MEHNTSTCNWDTTYRHYTVHSSMSRSSTGGDSTSDDTLAQDGDDAAPGVCIGRVLELQYTSWQ